MKRQIGINDWTPPNMKKPYRREKYSTQAKPDLSRFYMRKSMKFYYQNVRPRSFFLRHFNWMVAPIVKLVIKKSMKSFTKQWSQY